MVAGGEAVLSSGRSEREVKVEEYFLGPRETVCGECEILTHLLLPKPGATAGLAYEKFMLREANALAVAGVAAMVRLETGAARTIAESSIALTAVAPTPVVARDACAHLTGKAASKALFAEAAEFASREARPITDIRGTGRYRAELVKILTRRALEEAFTRAGGEGFQVG
jgi:carbon-monoxide dehydrogenase medium subunit